MARHLPFENPLSAHRSWKKNLKKIKTTSTPQAKRLNPIWRGFLMAIISHKLIKSEQSFPFFFFLSLFSPPRLPLEIPQCKSRGICQCRGITASLSQSFWIIYKATAMFVCLVWFEAKHVSFLQNQSLFIVKGPMLCRLSNACVKH